MKFLKKISNQVPVELVKKIQRDHRKYSQKRFTKNCLEKSQELKKEFITELCKFFAEDFKVMKCRISIS